MKILDKYILTTYLKTFWSVFIIFMFIFVLQGLWLYISELAGKDLDGATTVKFIFYSSPKLIPLVVPLTVLLSSIMVFGNFAENYEFAAMKSTGISLQRAMRSLIVFIFALGVGCFFFANNAIPWGEYNFYNLRRNIAKVKPALAIAEGQFNEIGNIIIKVDEKYGERGQYLKNVIIYKKKSRRGNYTVIVSESGELKSDEDSNILKIELQNGNYYDELIGNNPRRFNKRKPHAQSTFETYTINYDLESLNNVDLDEKKSDNRYNMLDITDLNYTIDSLFEKRDKDYKTLSNNLYNRTTYHTLKSNFKTTMDTVFNGNVIDIFGVQNKIQILNTAINSASSTSQVLQSYKKTFDNYATERNKHIIALHEKYALGFACLILFFVGAPLGALIRKGGIGLPMVIAILLFLTYHFIGMAIKNNAKANAIDPALGTWLSTLIMLPLSIYLTNRATNDKGPITFDSNKLLKPLIAFFGLKKRNSNQKQMLSDSSDDYKLLLSFNDTKLKQILKQYRDFGYTLAHKNSALSILQSRGTTKQELKLSGYLPEKDEDGVINSKYKYIEYSNLSFILYGFMVVFSILGAVLMNNKFPSLGIVFYVLGGVFAILFVMGLIKTFEKHEELHVLIGKPKSTNPVLFSLLGFPLYFVLYFIQKQKINRLLKQHYQADLKLNDETTLLRLDEKSKQLLNDFKDYSNTSFISFILATVLFIVHFISKPEDNSQITQASLQLALAALVFFIVYVTVEIFVFNKLYKSLNIKTDQKINLTALSVIPVYPLRYLLLRTYISKTINDPIA